MCDGAFFRPKNYAKVSGYFSNVVLGARQKEPLAWIGAPAFGVFGEYCRRVEPRIERDRQQNHPSGEPLLQACEIRREPGANVGQGTARVDKIHCHQLPLKTGQSNGPAILPSEREVRHRVANRDLVFGLWKRDVREPGLLQTDAPYRGSAARHLELEINARSRLQSVQIVCRFHMEWHRHGFHVSRYRAMRNCQRSMWAVDGQHNALPVKM